MIRLRNSVPHSGQSSQRVSDANDMHRLLACGRSAAEADDVAIGILDIEALRAPLGRRDRLDDRHAVGECFSRNRLTPELTGAGNNAETIQVNDERQANSASGRMSC